VIATHPIRSEQSTLAMSLPGKGEKPFDATSLRSAWKSLGQLAGCLRVVLRGPLAAITNVEPNVPPPDAERNANALLVAAAAVNPTGDALALGVSRTTDSDNAQTVSPPVDGANAQSPDQAKRSRWFDKFLPKSLRSAAAVDPIVSPPVDGAQSPGQPKRSRWFHKFHGGPNFFSGKRNKVLQEFEVDSPEDAEATQVVTTTMAEHNEDKRV